MVFPWLRQTLLIQAAAAIVIHAMTAVPCLGAECSGDTKTSCEPVSSCEISAASDPCTRMLCEPESASRDEGCFPGLPFRCDPPPDCPVWCSTPCVVTATTSGSPGLGVEALDTPPPASPRSTSPQPDPPPPKRL